LNRIPWNSHYEKRRLTQQAWLGLEKGVNLKGYRERFMSVEGDIRNKLTEAFAPEALEIVNDSHRHVGHAGSPGTGESHFTIKVVSAAFAGKSRLERHRMVNQVLSAELAGRIHALAVTALAPEDVSRSR
jgi:BolA protein